MTGTAYPAASLFSLRRQETDPLAFLQDLARSHDAVVPFELGGRRAFLLNDPAAIEDVLVRNHRVFRKGPGFDRAKRLLGDGLLTATPALHARRRAVVQPAFRHHRLATYAQLAVARAQAMRDQWVAGHDVDVARAMRELTLAISGDTLFGSDFCGLSQTVADAVSTAVPEMDGLLSVVASRRHAHAARRMLDDVLEAVINRRMVAGEGADAGDLLSMLLAASDGSEAAKLQVRDDAVTFLLASHDTISHALTWTWTLLAKHPHADAALAAELSELGLTAGAVSSADTLPALRYTRAVLAESLRLFPPAWIIVREAASPSRVAGVQIPLGALVMASPFVTHRDSRFFTEPLKFDPNRWLSDSLPPKLAYVPFGAGPRACIGEGFAWMEGTLILATLAARWQLRRERDVAISPRITLRPRGPVTMRLTLR